MVATATTTIPLLASVDVGSDHFAAVETTQLEVISSSKLSYSLNSTVLPVLPKVKLNALLTCVIQFHEVNTKAASFGRA